jgi:xkdN-like protein
LIKGERKVINLVEKLLKLDKGIIDFDNVKEIEFKRLSSKIGEPFVVEVRGLSRDRYTEIASIMFSGKGTVVDAQKTFKVNCLFALEAMVSPDLKDKDLLEHFECATPLELLKKMFLPGEIAKISEEVGKLSGFSDNVEEEVKNS